MTTRALKTTAPDQPAFSDIVQLIHASRQKALQSVNTVLIDLYWKVGEIISRKLEAAEWGRRRSRSTRQLHCQNAARTPWLYEKYKDSGVEWLGEVPEHWELVACRGEFVTMQTRRHRLRGITCGQRSSPTYFLAH